MNKYRVDRANSARTPCGMNSLLYIGGSHADSMQAFHRADPGYDCWGAQNQTYGVVWSVFDEHSGEYVVKRTKGLS